MDRKRSFHLCVVAGLALVTLGSVAPQARSPFVGEWQGIDADGGDIRLTIGGPPGGPFGITWTEGYFGYCGGEAGIARGEGRLSPDDPYVLEANLLLACFTTGQTLEMKFRLRYDPVADTVTAGGEGEMLTTWHRPGSPPAPPSWIVIAHPADGAVDGGHFPEGTVVSLLVLDDEHNVIWYGTGTAGYPEWDPEHTWVQYSLDVDLMAGAHLWMYDGVNAKELVVTALEVSEVDMASYTVSGRAEPGSQVFLDWTPEPAVVTAGQDGSWEAQFDGSHLGQAWAAYQPDSDGDQTRVGFYIPRPRIVASAAGNWFWTTEFAPEGLLTMSVYDSSDSGAALLWEGTQAADASGFVSVGLDFDIVPGNYLTVSDGVTEKGIVLEPIAMEVFDVDRDYIAGTAPPDRDVWVAAGPQDWQVGMTVRSAAGTGEWEADFTSLPEPFDITEDMRGWSYAQIFDEDGDANEAGAPPRIWFSVFPEWEYVEGWNWPMGATVTASVEGKPECAATGLSGHPEWDPQAIFVSMTFPEGCDVEAGNEVTLTDGMTTLTHTVQKLAVTEVDELADTVTGTADPGGQVHVWAHGYDEVLVSADANGTWTAALSVDLVEGMCGRSEIRDDNGNATAVDWCVSALISVTGTDDMLADDGVCTLREAIIAANTNSPSGSMEGECPAGLDWQTDTVALAADATYSLVTDSTDEDGALDGDLDIWDNAAAVDLVLMVEGDGRATISQDASVDDRVLNVMATVRARGLTLTGGGGVGAGAGVQNTGTLFLEASAISGNRAGWAGGGIFNSSGGTLTVDSSSISANSAANDGGGGLYNEGTLTLLNSTISDNTANHDGGGIANNGMLTIDAGVMSGNSGAGGGALANWPGGEATVQNGVEVRGNSAGTGGGLFNHGTLSVVGSAVSGNSAEYGGGIANWGGQLTLTASEVSGNAASASAGGIHNKDGGTTTIEESTVISGNTAAWDGGGINNWAGTVNVRNSSISGNSAGQSGGGILNLADGVVVAEGSAVSGNSANDGGGLANWGGGVAVTNTAISANQAAWGGGIFTSRGTLTLDASTVADNTATSGDGGIQIKDGANVTVRGGSLVSGNSAPNGYGGGVSNWGSLLTIDASSVLANSASVSGGGILNKDGGTTTIQNGSVISGNTAAYEGGISNWGGSLLTVDGSVISDNSASGSSGGIGNLGTLTVSNSRIAGNSAPWGAGLWNRDGTMTVSASVISANSAVNGGGGILNWNGSLTVTGSVLRDNSADGEGDAVYSSVDTPGATTVTESCIVGNGATAFLNEFLAVQIATGNWWGDASGPSGAGPGTGDSVSAGVDFSGWLTEAPAICASG